MSIGRNAGGIIPHGMAIDFEQATDGDTKTILTWSHGVNKHNQK
jgi:phage gp29-like protein